MSSLFPLPLSSGVSSLVMTTSPTWPRSPIWTSSSFTKFASSPRHARPRHSRLSSQRRLRRFGSQTDGPASDCCHPTHAPPLPSRFRTHHVVLRAVPTQRTSGG
uniref:Putative chaperonin subunit n=1 Tax=Ixodes ricinus TaxID=34613 RepID=A0A0K8REV5_IXORI